MNIIQSEENPLRPSSYTQLLIISTLLKMHHIHVDSKANTAPFRFLINCSHLTITE